MPNYAKPPQLFSSDKKKEFLQDILNQFWKLMYVSNIKYSFWNSRLCRVCASLFVIIEINERIFIKFGVCKSLRRKMLIGVNFGS